MSNEMSYALCQKILTETVPPVLAEAAQLAGQYRKGAITKLDLVAHDVKLRKVIEELVFGFAKLETKTGLRTSEYQIESQTAKQSITAIAPMAFCPESALIVHAPIMLGRMIAISTNLLDADHSVTGLKDVRIQKPVIADLRITVTQSKPKSNRYHAISGQLEINHEPAFWFYGEQLTNKPVCQWLDNRLVNDLTNITHDPANAARHFLVQTQDSDGGTTSLTMPEAIQILLEAIMRAIVIHRNLDGRGILLAGIPEIRWPRDLATRILQGGKVDMHAHPLGRMNANSPWHRVLVDHKGSLGTGTLDVAEARTTLTALFR